MSGFNHLHISEISFPDDNNQITLSDLYPFFEELDNNKPLYLTVKKATFTKADVGAPDRHLIVTNICSVLTGCVLNFVEEEQSLIAYNSRNEALAIAVTVSHSDRSVTVDIRPTIWSEA